MNLKPVLAFDPLTELCQQAPAITISQGRVTNGLAGTFAYKGPGTTAAGQFNPASAGFGTHTIWYVYTTSGGCKDSVSQTIRVNATPLAGFSVPGGGCLDPSGRVSFTNTSSAPDGLALDWLWDFGDPNATSGNPNTSNIKDPSHDYREGTFSIKLTVTSAKGCSRDTVRSLSFGLRPILAFAVISSVCEDAAAFSVAKGSIVNGLTGTGIYRGPGTDASGLFNPAQAGSGTHTIRFVFTTTGGCTDSATQTVIVHPRPRAIFNATSEV
jgi:hypothetical protein